MTLNESSVLLAADFGDILRFLIIALIIGFSIIGKLLKSNADARAQNNQNRPRPAPGPRPPAAERPQPQGIEQEIETFLRQTRGGKHAAAHRPPPEPPRGPAVVEAVPVSEAIEPGHDFGRDIAAHVKEHLDSKPVGESATHLAERIEAADENVEHHLEEVFVHDVGRLAHADQTDTSIAQGTDATLWDPPVDKPDTTRHGIREMLRSPGDIRKVFILSEILHRREF
ncbi:MAG: hypothetical protein O7B81_03525 [Gammaproteobacteria bacterium]|nr:hypothetical protein [Gammaproteobacteria bacterium]